MSKTNKFIRIYENDLKKIIYDKLINVAVLDCEDADECLVAIMEAVSKNETFKPGRR